MAATGSGHNRRASNEVAIPNEEYVSDALDLMVKAGWVKPHGHHSQRFLAGLLARLR